MKIIVGLGNPGLRYRNTRHNVGFLVLNALARKHALRIRKKGFGGKYAVGRILRNEVMLFEPLTYMNLSGEAVSSICSSKLEEKADLLVVSDDVNLDPGSIRLREKGSSGGHNGLKSIIDKIGPDFARLRIGIGADRKIADMSSHVLAAFPRREKTVLNEVLEKAVECIEIWLAQGVKEAMGKSN
ncbi:MAG: aminoacyl-tRNA hydrolase [Candidatus Omnitrophica bacterium]|nr:aminoacyl-tRNA hydrolase [Candidatus Omnitrophota bacterium]